MFATDFVFIIVSCRKAGVGGGGMLSDRTANFISRYVINIYSPRNGNIIREVLTVKAL